jgi:hypothetical protein
MLDEFSDDARHPATSSLGALRRRRSIGEQRKLDMRFRLAASEVPVD